MECYVYLGLDRWFLCKKLFIWLSDRNFDWVTKAKRNTVLFRKVYDPVLRKEIYIYSIQEVDFLIIK
jgi:hypothetical protein